jgi:opacity protein-like surface antigen
MKFMVAGLVGMLALSGVAHAQTASPSKGYVEGVAQSAFGNVTSQSFGVEGGVALNSRLTIFAEAGMVRDTADKAIGPSAQKIAVALGTGASYSVRQPVGFGALGARVTLDAHGRFTPYLAVEGGMAQVKRDVKFLVSGTDVTDKLATTYGVTLGSDLAGTTTKPLVGGGVGVVYNLTSSLVFDANYRFNIIMTDSKSTNVNRVGAGIGFRF